MRTITITLPEPVAAAVLRRIEGRSRPEESELVNDAHDRIANALQAADDDQAAADAAGEEPGLAPPTGPAP